jgi:hypothetical protein
VNAAFIMLTSAWLAGADPAPPVAPPAAAPAAPAVVSTGSACGGGNCGGCGGCSGCGDACGDSCEHGRKHLLAGICGKFKGRSHHDCCDTGCAAPCAAPAPCCAPKPVCCAPAPTCCAPKPVCCAPAPCAAPCGGCGNECCEEHHRKKLFAGLCKMKGKRHHDECCGGCDTGCGGCGSCCGSAAPAAAPAMPGAPIPAPGAEPKKMPTTIGASPAKIRIEEGVRNPFELARRYEGKAQASSDYSKLTGQLFFVHTDGGRWVLRYAPISAEDKFGGSVILSREFDMSAFHEGDFVNVEGQVLAEKSNLHLGGALYRANKVTVVERSQGTTAE